jgi:hypothetical protein
MSQETAIAIFRRLADLTFAWKRDTENGEVGETSPVFNVRLDAATKDFERGYPLDRLPPNVNDSLRYLLEVAAEFDAEVELENGGVAIR